MKNDRNKNMEIMKKIIEEILLKERIASLLG